jgi:hypothetical protein
MPVSVEFDPGCEAMIFSTDGVPLQGIFYNLYDNLK